VAGFEDAAARWNGRYAADGFVFGTEPNDTLAAQAALFATGDRVLCVADGEGRNSTWLAARGCAVTAFDIAERGLAKAAALAGERGVQVDLRQASTQDWGWDDPACGAPFDAVVAVFVQFATPAQRTAMFEGFARALRPGGMLLLVGYGPLQMTYRTGGPGILEAFGQDGVGIDVREDGETFGGEDFGGAQCFNRVGQQILRVGVDLQFDPLGQSGRGGEAGEADRFLRVHGAARVGEKEVLFRIDEIKNVGERIAGAAQVGPAQCDGDDLRAAGLERVAHELVRGKLACAEEET
jgi:SAM-dependent methyltransferase